MKYSFSVGTIKSILITIPQYYRKTFRSGFLDENIINILRNFLENLRRPAELYALRLNTVKLGPDPISEFNRIIRENHTDKTADSPNMSDYIPDPGLPFVYTRIKGPNSLMTSGIRITIDKFAAESVMIGADLYIPGFLHNFGIYNFRKGDKISIFAPGGLHIAEGIAEIDSSELYTRKKGLGVKVTRSLYTIPKYRNNFLYTEGYISDQTISSALACVAAVSVFIQLLKGSEDAVIYDFCSAPGHKTCCISELIYGYEGFFPKIISVDRSANRLEVLRSDMTRLGLKNITIIADKIGRLPRRHPELIEGGDIVILDPPCSALGSRPKLYIEHDEEKYTDFFLLQRRFLKDTDQFVAPGGYLLFSTCTFTIPENECVISYAIDKLGYEPVNTFNLLKELYPERFRSINTDFPQDNDRLPGPGNEPAYGFGRNDELLQYLKGLPNRILGDRYLTILDKYWTLDEKASKKIIRIHPLCRHTGGYFFAVLKKK